MLKKNTFNYQDYIKQVNNSIKFMDGLERQANITDNTSYTLVPMHKLTQHKLIVEDIKLFEDILDLPAAMLTYRFAFQVELVQPDNTILKKIYHGDHIMPEEEKKLSIKSIKIRYLILFEASTKEHQKQGAKMKLTITACKI